MTSLTDNGERRTMATRQLSDLPYVQQHLVLELSGRLASKFAGVFRPETVERFVVDSWDQLQPTAKTTAMLPLLTERFARERLQALATVEGSLPSLVPGVLFLCVHNAGRSQMAAGWMRRLASDRVVVYSGGSEPASEINAAVIEAMDEVGIDIRAEFPKPWTEEVVRAVDVVITMGCGDACPPYPGKPYEDWELSDPAGRDIESVRPIRDEIKLRVEALLASLGVSAG
jgi:arsenate reductase